MGLGKSSPYQCNRVYPDTIFVGLVSVTDPMSIHLNDSDGRDSMVLKPVVDLEVGAEVYILVVEGRCASIGNMTISGCCPHRSEITDKVTSLCKW